MSVRWKIVHVQLDAIPPLLPCSGEAGVYVYVWQRQIPLGRVMITTEELPVTSAQAAELIAAAISPAVCHYALDRADIAPGLVLLGLSTEEGDAPQGRDAPTAVIICSRRRPTQLERCLASVDLLTHRPAEIVVIDNSDGDAGTRQVALSHPSVRYVSAPSAGSSRARNTGIRLTSAPLVAFLDDDMVASPNWLAELTRMFARPDVMATSGLVAPAALEDEEDVILDREFGGLSGSFVPVRLDIESLEGDLYGGLGFGLAIAGNMAFRREVFERHGLFDERLGADAAGSGEDTEMWQRILAGGSNCAHVPSAVVHHTRPAAAGVAPGRLYFRLRGHVVAGLVRAASSSRWRNWFRLLRQLTFHVMRTVLRRSVYREPIDQLGMQGVRGAISGILYWLCRTRVQVPRLVNSHLSGSSGSDGAMRA